MKKKEILFVVFIIIVSIIGGAIFYLSNKDAKYANVIFHDSKSGEVKTLLRFNINEDNYYELDVPYGKFHIEVKNGQYRATQVDCPNQTCVNVGWVPSLGYYAPIICIPNGITIEIEE